MTRDKYLENALEQWKLWGPEISSEEIKPIMELMLYHIEEPIRVGIRRFFVICRNRYMELKNAECVEDKNDNNRCCDNSST